MNDVPAFAADEIVVRLQSLPRPAIYCVYLRLAFATNKHAICVMLTFGMIARKRAPTTKNDIQR